MDRSYLFGEVKANDIAGYAIGRNLNTFLGKSSPFLAAQVVNPCRDGESRKRAQPVVIDGNGVLEIVKLHVDRLQRMHGMIKRRGGNQIPVPHVIFDHGNGAGVAPEQGAGAETVSVAQLVVVPDVPDGLGIHGPQQLGLPAVLLDGGGLPVLIGQGFHHRSNLAKTAAVQVIPDSLVHRPYFFRTQEALQGSVMGQAGKTVFRVKAVDAAAARRGLVQIMQHGVHLDIGTAVVDAVAFALLLPGTRAVQLFYELPGAANLCAFVGCHVEGHAGVIAHPLDAGFHIGKIGGLVLRVAGVSGHEELFPHQESVLVAKLVEIVAFHNSAAPEAQEVESALGAHP